MADTRKAGPEEGSPLRASLGQVLRTLGDLIVLNWLCVLCALPVVTAGPALCALYYVTLKLARGEEVPALRGFLDAFRANFKRGAALGLLVLALGAVAAGDALFALRQEGALRVLFLTVATIVAVLALTLLCYVFPLQARFQNTWKGQVKNAFAPGGHADAGLCVLHRGDFRPGVAGLPGAVEDLPPGAPGGGRSTKLNPKENCLWIEKPRGGGPGLWWRR